MHSKKGWYTRGKKKGFINIKLKTNNLTVIGAVSEDCYEGYMMIEGSLDQDLMRIFLNKLSASLDNKYGRKNYVLIFDNARAHTAFDV